MDEIEQIFSETLPSEGTWQQEGQVEKMLLYEFSDYDIEFYFLDDVVLLVSISMLPD